MGKIKSSDFGLHIVITGNPVDGLVFYGPFKTGEEATEWAGNNLHGPEAYEDWWIAPLGSKEAR